MPAAEERPAAPEAPAAHGDAAPLEWRPRLALLAAGWGLYLCAGPGCLTGDGSALGLIGFAFWAAAVARPGRRAWLVEWLVAAVALGMQLAWIRFVFWPTLPYVFLGAGAYAWLGGALVRRLSCVLPLGLAAGLGWIGAETLRALVPPPFGMGWLRAGHYLHDLPAWLGSARVWGVVGLSFAGVAAAGALAELVLARRRVVPLRWGIAGPVLALVPFAVAPLFARLVPAPETEPGPSLLLVQPGFPQERKQRLGPPEELFAEQRALTAAGLAALEEPPDLVCWGETMVLVAPLVAPELRERVRAAAEAGEDHGLAVDPWLGLGGYPLVEWVAEFDERVRRYVIESLVRRTLPDGTSFLSGAERLVAHDGKLRRQNTIALWGPDGTLRGVGEKRHLAPGGETMLGFERFTFVREVIYDLANYVPDFLAGTRTGVLPLETTGGATHRLAVTACFDNAFVDVYLDPVAREPVDLHVVVSNEAWFRRSQEYDQMLVFSRFAAVMSGRSVVRATNGGVSAAYDPRGREIARLVVDGEDRLVRGTLAVRPPVPTADDEVPPVARTHRAWRFGAVITAFLLAAIGAARIRYSRAGRG